MIPSRKRRLKKIANAQIDLESCLLTLRDFYGAKYTNSAFSNLYYLIALAKRAKQP